SGNGNNLGAAKQTIGQFLFNDDNNLSRLQGKIPLGIFRPRANYRDSELSRKILREMIERQPMLQPRIVVKNITKLHNMLSILYNVIKTFKILLLFFA
ncbi:hypothetical protein Ccrd_001492, partial [Cynara cardunculus var. scolymus]